MADFGRHDADYRERQRERDFDRERAYDRNFDRDYDREYERSRRRGLFSARDRDEGDDRRRFDGSRSSAADRRNRFGRDRGRDEAYYGYDDNHQGLPIDETGRLIASNKVEGTSIYGRNGDRLGTTYNLMIDKFTGQVEYAVMAYGGFLGMGARYYPLPWRVLEYDPREGGYRIDMTRRDFEHAPNFSRDDEPRFTRDYKRRVNNWYGLEY